ncbi:ZMYM1 protein, partial [Amia calva]|nr:ZMYM1 protein [Amia calva]
MFPWLHYSPCIQYLARQGIALRGHDEERGHFSQLLKCKAADDPTLNKWLAQKHNFKNPQIQNDILSIMSNDIIRGIADTIHSLPVTQFALIVDGTQDVSGTEQESVCLRYVDHDLIPHEEFIVFYAIDVLSRLHLPLSALRGQTYDGAANMSGKYSGAQAIIRKKHPLSLYVHCGAHCVNLVTQKAYTASKLLRDSLDWSAATANGLHQQFLKGNTLLGLVSAGAVIGELECLNTSLQRKTQTISGMKDAVYCVQSVLKDKRNEEAFQSLFEQATVIVNSLNLEAIKLPKLRQPPKCFSRSIHAKNSNGALQRLMCHVHQDKLDLLDKKLVC